MNTSDARMIGPFLRELRKAAGLSIREAARRSGVSNPYLSQVERNLRKAGPNILKRLAPIYGATVRSVMERAGYLQEVEPVDTYEAADVERAYQFVVADPRFRFGTRPRKDLDVEAKQFIIEMYESLTGRKLL